MTKEPKTDRNSIKNDFISFNSDNFKRYKKETNSSLSYPAAKSIIESVYNKVYNHVIHTGLPVDFYQLGYLKVRKHKPTKAHENPLWISENNKRIAKKYTNRHTNGYIYSLSFIFGRGIPNKHSLKFRISRDHARNLAKLIFQGKLPPI